MSDSWQSFLDTLSEECRLFNALNEKALALSNALVANVPEVILAAQTELEQARKAMVAMKSRRRAMQQRGFGNMPLASVCQFAPPQIADGLKRRAKELVYHTTALELINSNNRALILGAMERLMAILGVMRRAQGAPLTYKRRGIMPLPDRSMIMSHNA
ncbi:MAG: hypothetical protein JO359_15415 [Candidatus Eremiobacteraeota bacterium]|nr:hypothetical protein [Candidatus Eremiobacteraeota bacterium]